MTARTVAATITDPTARVREGLAVYFHPPAGHAPVVAMTDASGVFRAALEPDVTYRVSVENAVVVDGVTFPAGTVILVRVPEGEGDVAGVDAVIGTVDASRPALLDAIADLERRVAALESPVAATGQATGGTVADLAGEVAP